MPGQSKAKIIKISIFITTAIFCFLLFLNPVYGIEVDYPDYIGYVNDFAGILDNASASDLEALITSIEKNTGAEIAVVTVDTLQGITIEEYAVELFDMWGIGKAEEDNGLLILVAIQADQLFLQRRPKEDALGKFADFHVGLGATTAILGIHYDHPQLNIAILTPRANGCTLPLKRKIRHRSRDVEIPN